MTAIHGVPPAASAFLNFVDASPTPFHATSTAASRLEGAGFVKLREGQPWEGRLAPGGKYFFTRNQSSLVAFTIGHKFQPGSGVNVVGAHTDSPNLRIRPISKRTKEGYLQCTVETYGGGLWHTWFDRDLSLAGRVIVSDPSTETFVSKLVKVDRPLLRIPTLAIHLDRSVQQGFKFNEEDHLQPILGLAREAEKALNGPANAVDEASNGAQHKEENGEEQTGQDAVGTPTMRSKHHPILLGVLADELGCDVSHIQDFELCLYDVQKASIGGVHNEFIFSPRLDNQMSCFCAVEALIASLEAEGADGLKDDPSIRAIALFDNEEVGSVSNHGAESNMLPSLIQRLVSASIPGVQGYSSLSAEAKSQAYECAISKSFLLSSDQAHGFHPNYPSFYQDQHRPKINGGPVLKMNAKQRYASTAATAFLLRRVAQLASVPLQEFEVRNDMPCGSTIGPMLSKTGIRTVDLGNPQLSMHSIRETGGSHDAQLLIDLFVSFFKHFPAVDASLKVDD